MRQMRIALLMFALFMVCWLWFTGAASAMPVEDILKKHLKDNYPWAEVEVTDITLSAEPSGRMPEKVIVEKGLPNRTVFALEYEDGKKITATAKVKAFDTVVMTRSAYRKGYLLSSEDVYTTLMDVARIPKDAVREVDQVIDTVLTRSVIANTPVVTGMVNGNRQVKKGQRVTIVIESESFSIAAKGDLKETAYVGSEVKVLNIDSKKVVTGRLINENTVKVVF